VREIEREEGERKVGDDERARKGDERVRKMK
jgi:hypothetical protein